MKTPKLTTNIDDIKSLEGQQVTLMLVNEMGFPVCRHIKVQKAEIVSAKRYTLAIALGWQDVKMPDELLPNMTAQVENTVYTQQGL